MAEKTVESAPEQSERKKKKKSWPTNCAQSNKRVRRKDWYYRNGVYFANKSCFKLYAADQAKKAAAAAAAPAAAASSESPAA